MDVSDGTSPHSHVQYVPDSPGAPREGAVLDIKSFRDLAKHSSESVPFLNGPEAIAVHAMKGVPGCTSDRSSAMLAENLCSYVIQFFWILHCYPGHPSTLACQEHRTEGYRLWWEARYSLGTALEEVTWSNSPVDSSGVGLGQS